MTKKKLLEDIKRDPRRFYRVPSDVLRDRRFGDVERLEILHAWQHEHTGPDIDSAIAEIEQRCTNGHAAE